VPRESKAARIERTRHLRALLARTYPDAHCELNFTTPLELLVATILSAQCTDKQVNRVTEDLFRKYRTAADFAEVDLAVLEEDIRRIGLFRNKAKNIQSCCRSLLLRHGGNVPARLEDLVQLDGVGRKTANVVLGTAFGINSGIVVDTHVARLSGRLGLSRETDPGKIEVDLVELVPMEEWSLFSHWLIWHGRRRCNARRPDCDACELKSLCPTAGRHS
jgi:endonuclease-3